jgi:hypothetical protein
MRPGVRAAVTIGVALALGAWSATARAEEAKTPIKATMMLSIIAQPVELSGRALDRARLEPGPPPAADDPRNRAFTVTVRNPCPPGDFHYEPRPLPGRRAR